MARRSFGPETAPSLSSEARKGAIAYNAWPRETGESRNEQRRNYQSDRREQFHQDVQRRSGGIFERVADRVADDGRFVRRTSFAAEIAGLDEFLRVVPCAAARVQDEGHENAHDRAHHERGPEGLTGGDGGELEGDGIEDVGDLEETKEQADGQGRRDGEDPGDDHLWEGAARADVDRSAVIGLHGARHDSRVLAELIPHVLD